jgi:hypothetical protein
MTSIACCGNASPRPPAPARAADQRGVARPRTPDCGIGAVKRSFGLDDLLFANGFE